ncbi:cytochrome-c peroxidase [Haliangium ochraceum]|uniref:Di-heme cytochrome c peroxidase n=1 Tax=Haliangium ochraceum (strain DSM 14365 / JCM 11303 / SMP-2) TaxID=502025 RepID=D0LVH0_HALO1|nr:cytochrome c peroxidase [Haliangium ochraceum]ACY17531.1 Di-heme cytochrome c peroxidase [Haliangium ochraceum DSM 14365]
MTKSARNRPLAIAAAALVAALVAALAGACEAPDQALSPGDEFSATEKRLIIGALGILPERPPPSPSNAYADDPRAVALGQKLFFDLRVGGDGETGCVTCHDPETGFQDARDRKSKGAGGFSRRHALTVLNAAYGDGSYEATPWQFWDGKADSLWSQALGPPEDAIEMNSSRTRVALLVYDEYAAEYQDIFGPFPVALRDAAGDPVAPLDARPGTPSWQALAPATQDAITEVFVGFGKVVAAYERRIVSTGSRFDEYYRELLLGDFDSDILDAQERRGLRLFVGKAQCLLCHSGPNFTTTDFWNIAVEDEDADVEDFGRATGLDFVRQSEFNCASRWSDIDDPSRCAVAQLEQRERFMGAFKTPGLRDVSKTAPYMHSGGLATLEEVIEHYNDGGALAGYAGVSAIRELNLSDDEKAALVAFMKTLDGQPLDPALLSAPAE